MALINCPECRIKISNTAKSCPRCGYVLSLKRIAKYKKSPQQNRAKKKKVDQEIKEYGKAGIYFVIGIVSLLIVGIIAGSFSKTDKDTTKDVTSSESESGPCIPTIVRGKLVTENCKSLDTPNSISKTFTDRDERFLELGSIAKCKEYLNTIWYVSEHGSDVKKVTGTRGKIINIYYKDGRISTAVCNGSVMQMIGI